MIIYGSCSDKDKRVFGSPCAPLQLKPTSQDDNEARKKVFSFEQFAATNRVPGFYFGSLSFTEPTPTGAAVTVTKDTRYKIASLETTAPITFSSVALEHGETLSLIGSGGSDPAVLSPDDSAPIAVILKEGASWAALPNAVIHLQVFKAGAKTILFEVSRG